ncbi:hypothetical protein CsSME_00027044 [Camellia sinensis var. sinensis]
MVHTLEAIRVGAIGTISALITHELDAIKSTPQMPISYESRPHRQTVPVSIDCGVSTRLSQPRRMQGSVQKKLHSTHHSPHGIPMLSSEDISMDRTSRRGRTTKKGFGIVEIVDFKCGNTEKSWSKPITDQFKKLNFLRLSD